MKISSASVNKFQLGLCSIVFLISMATNAFANPIQILDSDYHIWGNVGAQFFNVYYDESGREQLEYVSSTLKTYDIYSSYPISDSLSLYSRIFQAASSVDVFSVAASAGSQSYYTNPEHTAYSGEVAMLFRIKPPP